ncbi:MAG TPA: hypothetical protein VGR27_05865, partial [Longimicrobiaceae bacterium]|nr:hypothetical protein [Longimicrobiaceae bacterium]
MKSFVLQFGQVAVCALLVGACGGRVRPEVVSPPTPPERTTAIAGAPGTQTALASITAEGILRHTTVLASDEFEGRAPGTRGEELTVNYLTEHFRQMGLQPGNPDGTYVQNVPLVGITTRGTASFDVKGT